MTTDEEQVEKLKAWLKENGLSIVFGIIIGVGGLSGFRYYQHQQEVAAENASQISDEIILALNASDWDAIQEPAQQLIAEYDNTEYAQIARLAMARAHVEKSEFDQAEEFLQQVIGAGAQEPRAYVARTRLAAVQMQSGKLDVALGTLAIEFPSEFTALVAELKGDILARQGNTSEAIEAYRMAQQAIPGPANPGFLQQKLSDLGGRG